MADEKLLRSFLAAAPSLRSGMEDSVIQINGEKKDVQGKMLSDYLAETSYDPVRIAVEKNGEIIPKAHYGETVLEDGDVIEIVSFVGGG